MDHVQDALRSLGNRRAVAFCNNLPLARTLVDSLCTTLGVALTVKRVDRYTDPHVDPERIGAIGYCFGEAVVLGQARSGADLDAVVSFHGALIPGPVDSGVVKARVLVSSRS